MKSPWKSIRSLANVVVLLVGISATNVASAENTAPRNAEDAYIKAGVVFLGQVETVQKDRYGHPALADVRVMKMWKGQRYLKSVVRVDGRGGLAYPARTFVKDMLYLFYLPVPESEGTFFADAFAHRVLPEKDAQADLIVLERLLSDK